MSDLSELKLEEEIALLKIERKAAQVRVYLDLLKATAVFLGAIVLFWFIQQPESILNRASSKESISRERAKLILEWIKENDPQKQANALAVIHAIYGDSDDEWIKKVEWRLQIQASSSVVDKLLKQYQSLIVRKQELEDTLQKEDEGFVSGKQGRGPIWFSLKNELASTKLEIENITEQLNSYDFKVFTEEQNKKTVERGQGHRAQ